MRPVALSIYLFLCGCVSKQIETSIGPEYTTKLRIERLQFPTLNDTRLVLQVSETKIIIKEYKEASKFLFPPIKLSEKEKQEFKEEIIMLSGEKARVRFGNEKDGRLIDTDKDGKLIIDVANSLNDIQVKGDLVINVQIKNSSYDYYVPAALIKTLKEKTQNYETPRPNRRTRRQRKY